MNESWHGIRNLGQSKLSMYDNCLNGIKKKTMLVVCAGWLAVVVVAVVSCSSIKWISLNGWRRLSAIRLCWFAWLAAWLADWRKSKSFVIWKWDCRRNWSNRTVYHTTYNACPDRAAWGREKKNWRGRETERRKSSEHNTISTHFHISSAVVKHWGSSCLSLRRCRNRYARCLVDVGRMARWNKAKQEPRQTSSPHLALRKFICRLFRDE